MVSGHKSRPDGAPVYRSSYHIRPETAPDNHWNSGLHSKPGRLQLAYHSPARVDAGFSFRQPRHSVDIGYLWDELAILSEQTFHTGQKYQKASLAKYRYFGGQKIVVAEFQFLDHHRIVFIDDRNDVPEAH
jgi:hypothetical protein